MYLCEEYMSRHSIKIPYAKLVDFGANFIKQGDRWNILTVCWKDPTIHPGYFLIRVIKPIHNGYKFERLFESDAPDEQVYLEQYEDFFYQWAANFPGQIARDEQIKIAAWETFLYCYDSLLVSYARMEELLATIDPDAPVASRLQAVDETMIKLYDRQPRIVENWALHMRKYIDHYNHWLPALVDYVHDTPNSN